MRQRVIHVTSVVAAALVMAYAGTAAISKVGEFALWRTDTLWLSVASALCGALLALISGRAFWMVVVASVLGVLLFGGVWSYITWTLLGQYFSFFDLILSDFVFLYVIQRGAIMFIVTVLFGLLGVVVVVVVLPGHYRH